MSEVTYYVALPFVLSDDGVAAADAIECFNQNTAVMKAEALSRKQLLGGHDIEVSSGDRFVIRLGDVSVARSEGVWVRSARHALPDLQSIRRGSCA
jgi:hypothetical protein